MNVYMEVFMSSLRTSNKSRRFVTGVASVAVSVTLACGCIPCATQNANADTAAEIQAQADSAMQQINSMQEIATEHYNEYVQALADYEAAKQTCNQLKADVDKVNEEMAAVQDRLGTRARSMYRTGSSSFLDLLFGSASFEEFVSNWDLLVRVNQGDSDLVDYERELREQINAKEKEYEAQAFAAEAKANEAASQYQQAQSTIEQMQAVYNNLSAEAQAAYAAEQQAAAAAQQAAASASSTSEAEAYSSAAAEYGATVNSDGSVYDSSTGQTYSSVSAYTSATGNDIVSRARSMIGSSYVWGGTGGSWGGFDCSGLVSYAITGQEGNRLGTTNTFMGYEQSSTPSVGDLVVNSGHVAVVSGVDSNGNITSIIHAINESQGVQETGMSGYFNSGDYTVVHSS